MDYDISRYGQENLHERSGDFDSWPYAGVSRPALVNEVPPFADGAVYTTAQTKGEVGGNTVPRAVPHPGLQAQVFGGQLRRGRSLLDNHTQLLSERSRMLERHIREIDERRNEMINHLYFAKRPHSGRTPQDIARFEKLLLELEKDRRGEYLSFWSDVVSVRGDLLEAAAEYEATRSRADLLERAASAGRLRSQSSPLEAETRAYSALPNEPADREVRITIRNDPNLLYKALAKRSAGSDDV